MTRTAEIANAIRDVAGKKAAAVSLSGLSEALGYDIRTTKKMLKGMPYFSLGKKKLFLITDVAKRIANAEEIQL